MYKFEADRTADVQVMALKRKSKMVAWRQSWISHGTIFSLKHSPQYPQTHICKFEADRTADMQVMA